METINWVEKGRTWCDLAGREVVVYEQRVYPCDEGPCLESYRVLATRCSASIECNLAGLPCKWAFTNPNVNPLAKHMQH